MIFKDKFGLDEKALRRNRCILESVVLSRCDKKLRMRQKNKINNEPLKDKEINSYEFDVFQKEFSIPTKEFQTEENKLPKITEQAEDFQI